MRLSPGPCPGGTARFHGPVAKLPTVRMVPRRARRPCGPIPGLAAGHRQTLSSLHTCAPTPVKTGPPPTVEAGAPAWRLPIWCTGVCRRVALIEHSPGKTPGPTWFRQGLFFFRFNPETVLCAFPSEGKTWTPRTLAALPRPRSELWNLRRKHDTVIYA